MGAERAPGVNVNKVKILSRIKLDTRWVSTPSVNVLEKPEK